MGWSENRRLPRLGRGGRGGGGGAAAGGGGGGGGRGGGGRRWRWQCRGLVEGGLDRVEVDAIGPQVRGQTGLGREANGGVAGQIAVRCGQGQSVQRRAAAQAAGGGVGQGPLQLDLFDR